MAGELDLPEFERWRGQAASALEASTSLAATQPGWGCFLAEQAAQLAIKGLLHAVGLAPWGHDLVALEARVGEALGAVWPGQADAALRLARHYIPTRYPDAQAGGVPAERYGPGDADAARAHADAILAAVDACVVSLTLEAEE